MNNSNANLRLQLYILIIGIIIMAGKFAAYFITKSNAILTDALESIVNIAAGALGVYSLYLAAKPRDTDHPYGHGKVEFISASVEGTLIAATGLMMIVKSTSGFFSPKPLQNLDIGLYITSAAGFLNYFMGWLLERRGKKSGSIVLAAGGSHLKSDAYTTVGVLAGLLIIYLTEIYWLDNLIAILLGLFIFYTGYHILKKSIAGIMDEADYEIIEKIVYLLNSHRKSDWVDIHNMRVIKYGANLHIDCHVTLPWYYTIEDAHRETEEIAELINNNIENNVEFFIHTDACIAQQCKICLKSDCNVRREVFQQKVDWNLDTIMRNRKHGLD